MGRGTRVSFTSQNIKSGKKSTRNRDVPVATNICGGGSVCGCGCVCVWVWVSGWVCMTVQKMHTHHHNLLENWQPSYQHTHTLGWMDHYLADIVDHTWYTQYGLWRKYGITWTKCGKGSSYKRIQNKNLFSAKLNYMYTDNIISIMISGNEQSILVSELWLAANNPWTPPTVETVSKFELVILFSLDIEA